jgi:hypothetical protein
MTSRSGRDCAEDGVAVGAKGLGAALPVAVHAGRDADRTDLRGALHPLVEADEGEVVVVAQHRSRALTILREDDPADLPCDDSASSWQRQARSWRPTAIGTRSQTPHLGPAPERTAQKIDWPREPASPSNEPTRSPTGTSRDHRNGDQSAETQLGAEGLSCSVSALSDSGPSCAKDLTHEEG